MMPTNKRTICIDPGQKRIGIAISDESGTLALPYKVITHVSREEDAAKITKIVQELQSEIIIMGVALAENGGDTTNSRRAKNLASELMQRSDLQVIFWDESLSSNDASEIRRKLGQRMTRKNKYIDHLAASIILQSYLERTRERNKI